MPTRNPGAEAARILDDRERTARLDSSGMYDAIIGFPDQLSRASSLVGQVDWTSFKPTTPAGVCVCGMGGSAIGGDLVRSYWDSESPVPMLIVRNDRLPAHINRFWLVIASSYSGDTEETLAAVAEAQKRHCRMLALTSNGQLAALAEMKRWPLIRLPGGLAPRAALGLSFGPMMLALHRWGVVSDSSGLIEKAAVFLKSRLPILGMENEFSQNLAKQATAQLCGRIVCVYGSTGTSDVVAYRLKCQLSENAKAVAFASSLPELNHNEIVGMDTAADLHGNLALVTLATSDDSHRATQRREWIEHRMRNRGVPVVTLTAVGENRLERLLSLVQLGDFISYYLAILSGHDPTPIPSINDLKSTMADSR